jgi:hypothetical protein
MLHHEAAPGNINEIKNMDGLDEPGDGDGELGPSEPKDRRR